MSAAELDLIAASRNDKKPALQVPNGLTPLPRDEVILAKFGKRQQLRRNFRFLSIVALTCTLMITWEGYLSVFQIELLNGGRAGIVYGFIFVWVGSLLQACVMGEMGSMIPVAGGQYNWVAVLAPPSCRKFLSYTTGWQAFIAWQATLASAAYLGGTMIQGLIVLNYANYGYERWHGTLLFYAVMLVSLIVNTYFARILPQIESAILVIHTLGFFAILIPLVYLSPNKATASEVFQTFLNGGEWPTDGVSFFVGLSGPMFAFIGIDAGAHMAEEIKGASEAIPTGMISSVIINGTLGFGMAIAVLFCLGDPETALMSDSQYPFIPIFANAVGSTAGGTAIVSVITAMMIFATIGLLTTSSRMLWAFARERGVPFHHYLSKVDPNTALPLYALGVNTTISILLALINIGSAAAFNALVTLSVAGTFSCFGISASVLLYKRLTTPDDQIDWGSFKLGRAGIPVTIAALVYTAIGFFFSFWPSAPSPTPEAMNWSSLVYGVVVIWSGVYWVIWGRHVYTGPIREVILEGGELVH